MVQEYNKYTAEDHLVWKTLYDRQIVRIEKYASQAVIDGMKKCGFESDFIPNFDEVNKSLKQLTGWQIYVVPGLIEKKPFFEHLHRKEFPATTWLRKMSQLDYLEEPDMFHDVFGHIPLLTNQNFCDFLEHLSGIALQHIDDEEIIEMLGRLYWFTVEFGLIEEQNHIKAYGAGILSSFGETEFSIDSPEPERLPFSVERTLHTSYHIDRYQDFYFVIHDYKQLFDSIPQIQANIKAIRV